MLFFIHLHARRVPRNEMDEMDKTDEMDKMDEMDKRHNVRFFGSSATFFDDYVPNWLQFVNCNSTSYLPFNWKKYNSEIFPIYFHSLPRNISGVPQCSSLPGSIQVLYRSYRSEMWLMFAVHYTWVEPQAVSSDLDFFAGFQSSAIWHGITVRLWNAGKTDLTVKLHSFSKGQDVSF